MENMGYISPGRQLRDWIIFSVENRDYHNCLCIRRDENEITMKSPVFLIMDHNLSESQRTNLYNKLHDMGYALFTSISELADIVETVKEQRPGYTDEELIEAIQYYCEHGDFLDSEQL